MNDKNKMKTIKKIFWVLLGLVLVVVLAVFAFYQFENYTGRKAWDQYVKECLSLIHI